MSRTRPYRTAGEALSRWQSEGERPSLNHTFHRHTPEMLARIRATPAGEGVYAYRQAWVRLHADRPAPTVLGTHGGVFLHPWQDRCLTPRELAALQSFPDDFIFYGSKSSTWVQIGNAVPVGLARAVGEVVLQTLSDSEGQTC